MEYPIVEQFLSVQGEGYWVGQPSYFIRLGGCPVGCSWCDTRHSWPLEGWPLYSVEAIVEGVGAHPVHHVVVTGGEPTIHDLAPLISALKAKGYFVQLETAGIGPVPAVRPDWITFSPKRFKEPLAVYYAEANELKVVIHAQSDFRWAEMQRTRFGLEKPAFLQPDAYQPAAVSWILSYLRTHPHWRLSLQMHRILAVP